MTPGSFAKWTSWWSQCRWKVLLAKPCKWMCRWPAFHKSLRPKSKWWSCADWHAQSSDTATTSRRLACYSQPNLALQPASSSSCGLTIAWRCYLTPRLMRKVLGRHTRSSHCRSSQTHSRSKYCRRLTRERFHSISLWTNFGRRTTLLKSSTLEL